MAVKEGERSAWNAQWQETEAAKIGVQSDLPDGVYHFRIESVDITKGNAMGLILEYKVVGGNDQFEGEVLKIRDNLDTATNMAWFKQKLTRLGIDPADWTDMDNVLAPSTEKESLGAALVGLVFEGQKKSKGGFDNVYINRVLSGQDDAQDTIEGTQQSVENEAEQDEIGIKINSRVSFTSTTDGPQEGIVTELFTGDDGSPRIRITGDNYKRYNLSVERVKPITEATETVETGDVSDTEVEETEMHVPKSMGPKQLAMPRNGKHRPTVPKHKAIATMRMPEIRETLGAYGINATELAKPREFLAGVAGYVHDEKYMPDMAELSALCAGFGVKRQAKPSATALLVRKAVLSAFKK